MENKLSAQEQLKKGAFAEAELDAALLTLKELAHDLKPAELRVGEKRATLPENKILENSGRAFLLGDIFSLLLSFVLGGLAAWALNIFVFDDSFQKLLGIETLKQFGIFAGIGLSAIFWLDSKEHYRQRLPYWEGLGHILKVAFLGIVVGGFIQFAIKNIHSRLWLGLSWTFFAVNIIIFRHLIKIWLDKRGQWKIPAIIIGQGEGAQQALKTITRETSLGYDIVSVIPAKILKDITDARGWLRLKLSTGAQHIFLALEGSELEKYNPAVRSMVRERLSYSIVPPWMGLPTSTLSQHHFLMNDMTLMHSSSRLSQPVPRFMKRAFDLVASTLGVIALSPVLAYIALRVRDDGGPALFTQDRVGVDGKVFKCYKFRSMRIDAEKVLQETLDADPAAAAEWKEFQKLKNDPRITRFGAFIRRTSIDELPQLLNVIKGEMSLVGPRPIMRGQEDFYGDDFAYYDALRPGITGPWQVSGRNKLTFKERVNLESWYVRNWTMGLDIIILLKTIPVLIKKDQAF